jgi:glutathione S-transferase
VKLIIGNKNYSSWSMRPWLLMTEFGIPFEEEIIWLDQADTAEKIAAVSPSGRVPVVIDGALVINDSLAIAEYLAEKFPEKNLWPADSALRARARSASAEMHSSFTTLRGQMGMNVRNRFAARAAGPELATDITRVNDLWNSALVLSGGPFLFGSYSIADAMFAPVVTRFRTYGVGLQGVAAAYQARMLATASMQKLDAAAAAEGHAISKYDAPPM